MPKLSLRKTTNFDKKYFAKWWRDEDLIKLTSGVLEPISEKEIEKYLSAMVKSRTDYHFMIVFDKKVIGHIALAKRRSGWYETQIVIGEKAYWGKGHGAKAVQSLLKKAKRLSISKIYLEVRPDNLRAIRAYEKCGFKKIKTMYYPKNKYLPKTLRMELKSELLTPSPKVLE
ncbi:MAG: GNAT family N-acetyltransferase [Patescibacteria group bacterium]|nr:GNAT family N-acetyltransferase [Patescibacteria group bacterium]